MRLRIPRTTLVLAVALALAGVSALAACGGDDTPEATPTEEAAEPTTAEEVTTAAEATTAAEETEETAAAEGDATNGATVFQNAGCGNCHTLEAAGAAGAVGPNLDDLQPDMETVVEQVTNGGGGMPPFGDQLSEQEILDVATYVVDSTQG